MNIMPYDPSDLATDIVLKHLADLNGGIIEDITTAIQIAFEDGYCRGYNAANEWYTAMDADIGYIESIDGVQPVDTFNDDLVGDSYGDVPSIGDINLYNELMALDANNHLFNRRNKNE